MSSRVKLQVPFIQLPILFDATRLSAELACIDESAWRPHPQGFAGNSMLPLVAVDGDPGNEAFAGAMRPTKQLDACPYLRQTIAAFGVTVGRTRLMRLAGQAEVTRHADQGYYWAERVRIHVPIVTHPTVRFECDDAVVNMAEGECWIFDTWRQHCVHNDATAARIHLVCDTVGGEAFWDLVAKGRLHGMPAPHDWRPARIAPGDASSSFACEQVNVPVVMSPWELEDHLVSLMADAESHPGLQAFHQRSGRLMRAWKALWALHGESPGGRADYREALDAFMRDVHPVANGIALRNGLSLLSVVQARIGQVAAGFPDTRSDAGAQRIVGDNA